jgi:hypothetical protein
VARRCTPQFARDPGAVALFLLLLVDALGQDSRSVEHPEVTDDAHLDNSHAMRR